MLRATVIIEMEGRCEWYTEIEKEKGEKKKGIKSNLDGDSFVSFANFEHLCFNKKQLWPFDFEIWSLLPFIAKRCFLLSWANYC